MITSRRNVLLGSAAAIGLAGIPLVRRLHPFDQTAVAAGGGTPDDWPRWAGTPAGLEGRAARLRGQAVDLRKFGARLDGATDDTAALERAIASGSAALLIPDGTLRLTRQVRIDRAIALFGAGRGPHIRWEGSEDAILIQPRGQDPGIFVKDVMLDGIEAIGGAAGAAGPNLVRAVNVRGLTLSRCALRGLGLVTVQHMLAVLGKYEADNGRDGADPAVTAGFSPRSLDDLNEDIVVYGNSVDYGRAQAPIIRFNFARRVVVFRNSGNFANVSWWGGKAKLRGGGGGEFLRRVSEVYIAENKIRGANGGIYGNNGHNVVVARNRISDCTDVGIDFEGCTDCQAYDNDISAIGNYPLATFYVARNVVFRNNRVVQDGSGATVAERTGAKRIGPMHGWCVLGLRSGGFGKRAGEVSISFIANHFVYTGQDAIGRCQPSFFNSVIFQDNTLENVVCDWRYRSTGVLTVVGNHLTFDRPVRRPITLLGGSPEKGEFTGNRVEIATVLPEGSVGLGLGVRPGQAGLIAQDNRFTASRAGSVPVLAVEARGRGARGHVRLRDNQVGAVLVSETIADDVDIQGPGAGRPRTLEDEIPRFPFGKDQQGRRQRGKRKAGEGEGEAEDRAGDQAEDQDPHGEDGR